MASNSYRPAVKVVAWAGLASTLAVSAYPWVDRAGLADHIEAGYPTYAQDRIDTAVMTYLVYLTVLGALGVAGWLVTMWATRRGNRWARWLAAALCTAAIVIALFNGLVRDTSGDTGLPPQLGWLGVVPCLVGILAVALMWVPDGDARRTRRAYP
ncbi:hypothetical protein [Micromonospora rubida]